MGQGSASIESFVSEAVRLQPAQDFRRTPIDSTPLAADTIAIGFHGALGFFNFLDLYWGWVPGGPNIVGLKFQFLGESLNASKTGSISLALALGTGLYVGTGAIPAEQIEGDPPITRRGFITEYANPHGELSFGYRPFDVLLVYLGYYRSNFSYVVSFDEGISDVYDHRGTLTMLHLGSNLKYGFLIFGLDISRSQLTFGPITKSETSFGLNSGLAW